MYFFKTVQYFIFYVFIIICDEKYSLFIYYLYYFIIILKKYVQTKIRKENCLKKIFIFV
jgi:hypothetical protein